MTIVWENVILSQFEATIDMFAKAISTCPNELWQARMWNDPNMKPEFSEFWYVAYHTLFWLDLYLTGSDDGFAPPPPFTLDELDPQGVLPDRVYTQAELLSYLAHCKQKCAHTLNSLTAEQAQRPCYFPWAKRGLSFAELLVDNMRHVQEHGAQLNMYLGQQAGITNRWLAGTQQG